MVTTCSQSCCQGSTCEPTATPTGPGPRPADGAQKPGQGSPGLTGLLTRKSTQASRVGTPRSKAGATEGDPQLLPTRSLRQADEVSCGRGPSVLSHSSGLPPCPPGPLGFDPWPAAPVSVESSRAYRPLPQAQGASKWMTPPQPMSTAVPRGLLGAQAGLRPAGPCALRSAPQWQQSHLCSPCDFSSGDLSH